MTPINARPTCNAVCKATCNAFCMRQFSFFIVRNKTLQRKASFTICHKVYLSYVNYGQIFSGCAPIHVAIEAHGKLSSKKALIDAQSVIHQLADRGASLNIPVIVSW